MTLGGSAAALIPPLKQTTRKSLVSVRAYGAERNLRPTLGFA